MTVVSKRRKIRTARVYLILDSDVGDDAQLLKMLNVAVRAGVDIVQLRDKNRDVREVLGFAVKVQRALRGRIPFIVNDRVDIALAVRADGVHLGQRDLPLPEARAILGPRYIVGQSCQTLAQALKAQRQGADYIGFGSVFRTLTKPERQPMDLTLLKRVAGKVVIPVFAIGGIDSKNIRHVTAAGVNRVAMTRAILLSPHVAETVEDLKRQCAGAA